MITTVRTRLLALLALLVMACGLAVVVGTSAPASASTTCSVKDADKGFGVRRFCLYDTTMRGTNINGSATWYYDSGQAANTGRLSFRLKDTAGDGRCAWSLVSNDYFGVWDRACGKGRSITVDRTLGEGAGAPRSGYYRLKLCTEKKESTCTTIWAQKIGQKPPKH